MAPAPVLALPPGLTSLRAVVAYDDDARALLTSLKNGGARHLVARLADALAALPIPPDAVVTWAPTTTDRRRRRGYDQAELLARALARRRRRPVRALLRRRPGPPQRGRSRAARAGNPVFVATAACPPVVVLIDDVATSGATLAGAARALRAAGTEQVHALVIARAG